MSHTPGPWFATDAEYPDGDDAMTQGEDGRWTVSTDSKMAGWRHDGGYPGYGVSKANANLMATAPDMLEAIKKALPELERVLDQFEAWPCADVIELFKEVVAKAEKA